MLVEGVSCEKHFLTIWGRWSGELGFLCFLFVVNTGWIVVSEEVQCARFSVRHASSHQHTEIAQNNSKFLHLLSNFRWQSIYLE